MTSLTQQAHQWLSKQISKGDQVIDATAGNGHDTLFLCEQVGTQGHVHAFDIQQQAISNTHKRLQQAGLASRATLFHCGHEHMQKKLPEQLAGNIRLVMFNLGYLPGSDKSCITRTDTTLAALQQSLALLETEGLLSLMLYARHPGGQQEAESVRELISGQPEIRMIKTITTPGPEWLVIEKIRTYPNKN